MKTITAFAFFTATPALAICFALTFITTAQAAPVAFDWATVGNAGNAGDAQSQGTFDQNGNVWEWNESPDFSSFRGIRGGSFGSFSSFLPASIRVDGNPTTENSNVGFRVASIPEPSTLLLGAMASVGLLLRRRGLS